MRLNTNVIFSIHLETNNNEEHGRKGNFFYGEILAVGCKPYDCDAYSVYLNKPLHDEGLESIIMSPEQYAVLVGHNIKFDLLYLWKYSALQHYLKEGGKIFDTQLAEYLISGQTHLYPALRDIAVNKYDCPERIKHIDDLVFNKKTAIYQSMKDVPKELVLEDVRNDVLDTEQVYLKQLNDIKQNGMQSLMDLMMNSLLATCEIEFNGMQVDRDVLLKNKAEQQQELEIVEKDVNQLIQRYWK